MADADDKRTSGTDNAVDRKVNTKYIFDTF